MKTLEQQIADECVHFNGLSERKCRAGVPYESVMIPGQGSSGIPCFRRGECVPCEHRHFPSEEDVQLQIAAINKRFEDTQLAIAEAMADATSRGLRKGNGGQGIVLCPICGGQLRYSIAGYNGHCHGKCLTDGCVGWMQ